MLDYVRRPVRVLGIDPGKSGAVCCLGKGRFEVRRDFKALDDITDAVRDLSGDVDQAAIEYVHAMPGEGVCSVWTFAEWEGAARSAMRAYLACPRVQVSPQTWQQYFRALLHIPQKTEFDSRQIAARLVPASAPFLGRKKDHNTGDAVLIALWRMLVLKASSGDTPVSTAP
jgi:hypothetical protein